MLMSDRGRKCLIRTSGKIRSNFGKVNNVKKVKKLVRGGPW